MSALTDFHQVWLVDFEYTAPPGDPVVPICVVAHEFLTGRTARMFADDLREASGPPYPTGPNTLFVAYNAAAEMSCHLALGWPMPECILDLYVEFRAITNGLRVRQGHRLLDALSYFGLDGISAAHKEAMVELALRGGPFSATERVDLLEYCESDVRALADLLPHMLPRIDLPRALVRGRYMAAVAKIERTGTPIDVPAYETLTSKWPTIKEALIREVDAEYGVFEGATFKRDLFVGYLAKHNSSWPLLDSGIPALDDQTFGEMSKVYPALAPLHQLRKSLGQLRLAELPLGRDGRNRAALFPFASRTSRNQPSPSTSSGSGRPICLGHVCHDDGGRLEGGNGSSGVQCRGHGLSEPAACQAGLSSWGFASGTKSDSRSR